MLTSSPRSGAVFTETFMQKSLNRRLFLTAINEPSRAHSDSTQINSVRKDTTPTLESSQQPDTYPSQHVGAIGRIYTSLVLVTRVPWACGFIKRNSGHDQDLSLLPLDHNVLLRVRFPTSQTRSRICRRIQKEGLKHFRQALAQGLSPDRLPAIS